MKQEVNPVVMWVTLGVILCVVVVIGFRVLNPSHAKQTTGSEDAMKKVQETGRFYTPPIAVPGGGNSGGFAGSAGAQGKAPGSMGGYNFTPPSH